MRTAGIVFASALGGLLLLTVAAGVWVGIRGFLAYGHLLDAQRAAAAIQSQLDDPAVASTAIADIAAETSAARSLTSDPVWRVAEGAPWIGPQLAAVSTVAASVDDVAGSALTPLAEVASTFSLDSLRLQDGRIDLSSLSQIQDAATAGAASIGRAAASVDSLDRAPLVAPVRTAVDELGALLGDARNATDALARASALMPAMLGADGPRDYLLLFQNNAEWRSLGGIPGAMAVVHTDGGAISLVAQDSTSSFPRYAESVLPLDPEVQAIYGRRPALFMQNVTQVPDFAVSASLAREMWTREHGTQVDGVIAVDPVTLSYILTATGPVTLPTGDVLSADNAVPLLLNDVYKRYARPGDQDALFAAASAAVFDALASGSADPGALVTALTRAGDERRLLLWSAHDDDQALLAGTTLAGGLPVTDAEASTFGVYLNDGTGSKMDYYLAADTQVGWESCRLDAGGRATGVATLSVTLTSTAPADAAGLPPYITGGGSFGVEPGSARTLAYVYLPEGFELVGSSVTDDRGFGGGFHAGRQVLSFTVDLAPGQSAQAAVTVRTPGPVAPRIVAETTPTIGSSGVSSVAAVCIGA
ncbi:DUF4012 domain-containing protein [Microbacterium ulmi]|uniref:DUF4012 domain-containing protein n=2 Tax=Microbacterium ulmi TaxID=179095 RepID=A0A7Y2M1K1_9MICO|nr:DUF4012 domain-containing protein [Microbacterium ulmi]NNH04309.1 DUF4012 domain-containing protein [Microbacterium ulmi]